MPRTRTTIKYVKNLTPEEFSQCRLLNFGHNGMMRGDLIRSRSQRNSDRAVLIKDYEGKIIAWSLVMETGKTTSAYFYVPSANRRKGLGTRLLKQVRKVDPKPMVFPHDQVSGGFFKKFKQDIKYDKWDAFFLED